MTLSWVGEDVNRKDVLQVSTDVAFEELVRVVPLNLQVVEKSQIHISGLVDGFYYARLAAADGAPASGVAEFEVRHRQLGTALVIFCVGAALFVALIAVVWRFAATEQ